MPDARPPASAVSSLSLRTLGRQETIRSCDGGRGRVTDTHDQTSAYAEVRADTALLTGKDNQEHLPHLWEPPPDPESRSPETWEDHGAQENDQLGGLIENANTPAGQNIQVRICERCGNSFEPRKGSGGKPQRFCSPECRKGSQRPSIVPNTSLNVETVPNIGKDVGKDVGVLTLAPPEDDSSEFKWDDENIIVPSQPAIAVYFNPRGDIVIRQEGLYGHDEDHFVYVKPQNLHLLIRRLQEALQTGA